MIAAEDDLQPKKMVFAGFRKRPTSARYSSVDVRRDLSPS